MRTHLIAASISAVLLVVAVGCVQSIPPRPKVTAEQTDTRMAPMFCGVTPTENCVTARIRVSEIVLEKAVSEEKTFRRFIAEGLNHLVKRSYDRAMDAFNAAWLIRPGDPAPYHGFGVITHRRDHDWATSEDMFIRGLLLSGSKTYLHIAYAHLLRDQDRHEDAIRQLEAAIAEDGKFRSLRATIAVHYKLLGNFQMACKWILREIDAFPKQDDLYEKVRAGVCRS